jgi:hypothetical protein
MRSLKSDGVCVVKPYEWDADAEAEAALIARNSAPGAVVLMYAYSYGVGSFFIRLARALQRYGIRIARLISCDGIRRFHALKIASAWWLSKLVSIPVPENVDRVYAFRQAEDWLLRGHRLVAENASATTIIDCPVSGYDHVTIDENESFYRVALQEFRGVIEGKEASL